MAYDASQFINERYIEMPTNRQVGEQTVWRVFSQLVSYASSDQLLVWVSDRTQAENSGIPRRSVRSARLLLLDAGLMLDTGKVKQKGVKVFQMKIPNYEFAPTLPTEPFDSGQGSGQGSGRDSGRDSGRGSGRDSGRDSGKADLPKTELEKNNSKKEYNQSEKNNLDHLPDAVRERIIRAQRRRGIYTVNNEITLGEGLKSVVEKLEKPTTDNEPF